MRFEFELTESGIHKVNQHIVHAGPDSAEIRDWIRSPYKRMLWIFRFIMIGLVFVWALVITFNETNFPPWAAWALLGSVALIIGAIGCEFDFGRRIRDPGKELDEYAFSLFESMSWDELLGLYQVEIDDDGLTYANASRSVTYQKIAITAIDRTSDSVIVYLDHGDLVPILVSGIGRTLADQFCDELETWSGKEINIIPA